MAVSTRTVPMQSVERVSGVLLSFATDGPVQKLSDIARRLDLPKSAVHRILDSLVHTGLVAREPDSARYRLGPRAIDLGMAAMGAPDIAAMAQPLMHDMTIAVDETTTLSLVVGWESVYLSQVVSGQDVKMTIEVGRRSPLYAGASGRAILSAFSDEELARYLTATHFDRLTKNTIVDVDELRARLNETRSRGYAASAGELDPSAAAVAAPIRTHSNRVVAAICICGPINRFTPDKVTAYGERVVKAAAELTLRTQ